MAQLRGGKIMVVIRISI